jgi:hypothetical protein
VCDEQSAGTAYLAALKQIVTSSGRWRGHCENR